MEGSASGPGSDPTAFLATAEVPSDDVLASLIGTEFLAYVCAASTAQVGKRISEKAALPTSAQETVFQETLRAAGLLVAHRQPMMLNDAPALEPVGEAFAWFGQFLSEHGMSVANALRVKAGGTLKAPDATDDLQRSVARLAVDRFPVLLIPEDKDSPLAGMSSALQMVWGHPALDDFLEALNRPQEALRALFPTGPIDRLTSSRSLMSSSGSGGTGKQAIVLIDSVLSNAETRARSRGRFELATFLVEVRTQIDELRQLAAGREVQVPAVVGLGAAQAADDFRLETPWGVLLAASDWHRATAPAQAGLVLLTHFRLKVELDAALEPGSSTGPPRGFIEAHADLEGKIDRVRLLLLLGLEREPPVALMPTWRLIADPTTINGFSWGPESPMPLSPELLSLDDTPRLREWADTIERHFHPSLSLAVRRTLASIAARHDPADGLVDAVIALENMFGTGQSEVGFRLSVALAWLLGDDAESRVECQRTVSRLYTLRSKIVHGSEVDAVRIDPERIAASGLAVNALRKLFANWSDLIPAGDQRGKLLILQGSDRQDRGS